MKLIFAHIILVTVMVFAGSEYTGQSCGMLSGDDVKTIVALSGPDFEIDSKYSFNTLLSNCNTPAVGLRSQQNVSKRVSHSFKNGSRCIKYKCTSEPVRKDSILYRSFLLLIPHATTANKLASIGKFVI